MIQDKAKAKARANKTFIVYVSLMIITYDCLNILIVRLSKSCLQMLDKDDCASV